MKLCVAVVALTKSIALRASIAHDHPTPSCMMGRISCMMRWDPCWDPPSGGSGFRGERKSKRSTSLLVFCVVLGGNAME